MIELKNILFQYHSRQESIQFQLEIDYWHIPRGEFLSIIGPNGCGKSTLLKLIAGLLNPDEGSISIENISSNKLSRKDFAKHVAYVPQSSVSYYPFTVYEIVMMGRTPYLNYMGFEKENDKEIVKEALDTLEITHLKNKSITELSGGEAQRVFIARAIAQSAKIILLDEPNSHLDLHHQLSIYELMHKFCNENDYTIISVSHDLNLVGIFSHQVVFMDNGRIILEGEKEKIFNSENIKKIFGVTTEVLYAPNKNVANVLIHPQK